LVGGVGGKHLASDQSSQCGLHFDILISAKRH